MSKKSTIQERLEAEELCRQTSGVTLTLWEAIQIIRTRAKREKAKSNAQTN